MKKKCNIQYYYTPNYLIINLWDKSNSLINKYKKKCPNSLTLIKENEKNEIIKFKDEIIYNGNKYKLDSCFLNIKDNDIDIENLAGITIENKKYIYNGWTQNYKKPIQRKSMFIRKKGRIEIADVNNPCGLKEYNWHINDKKQFYIDNCDIKEKTDEIKKSNLLSFNNSERILIYVLDNNIPSEIQPIEPNIENTDIQSIKLSISSQSKQSQSKSSETELIELLKPIKSKEIIMEGGKKTKYKKLKKYI